MTSDDSRWPLASHLLERMNLRDELDSLLESLIPVLDSFDRLECHVNNGKPLDDPADLVVTCVRIGEQMRSALADSGLVPFGARGDSVDLGGYRVIGARPCADLPARTVVEVVRPGYQKDGRIFRSAEVIVADGTKESQA
ncbi:nucleotide exchange factor GrpE [Actinocrispum wychmicini]|uniref:GrpE protein n=1 Tax=Actinocrispum wychmicini TaxID=1213861 RepID=A0A4R2JPR1_9PSEU|nr:nucleotide exchange factor GrpE [Actinocrispum wychmicini]TCO62171.1 GrpE protein [Actinocrispum wychmicini]